MTTSLEQQLQEFREKFGTRILNARIDYHYGCGRPDTCDCKEKRMQEDPNFFTDDIEASLKEALTTSEKRGAERVMEEIESMMILHPISEKTRIGMFEKGWNCSLTDLLDFLHPNDTSV